MYEVFLERTAEKDLRRLPAEDFNRIIPHIKALGRNPRASGSRKITGSKSDWRIRVGR
jgi:mRNA interferase RelE/StbE